MTATPTTTSTALDYERRGEDDSHIKVLVICHWVWGGLVALLSLIPLIHVGVGVAMIFGAFDNSPQPPPAFVGWLFIVFGGFIILLGETMAALTMYSAYLMSRRRRRVFSIVVAAINCLSVPLGTLLGVFTIIVLSRENVRREYEQSAAAAGPPTHPAWR